MLWTLVHQVLDQQHTLKTLLTLSSAPFSPSKSPPPPHLALLIQVVDQSGSRLNQVDARLIVVEVDAHPRNLLPGKEYRLVTVAPPTFPLIPTAFLIPRYSISVLQQKMLFSSRSVSPLSVFFFFYEKYLVVPRINPCYYSQRWWGAVMLGMPALDEYLSKLTIWQQPSISMFQHDYLPDSSPSNTIPFHLIRKQTKKRHWKCAVTSLIQHHYFLTLRFLVQWIPLKWRWKPSTEQPSLNVCDKNYPRLSLFQHH